MRPKLVKAVSCCLALAVLLSLAALLRMPATSASAESLLDTNILYQSVEKTIEVSRQKVCSITETITVEYAQPGINVGLSRNVSRWNKVTRLVEDKKISRKTRSRLTLQSVTMDGKPEYHFLETQGDYFYINTGADGDYKHGAHVYEIRYTYDMGEDFIRSFDDFTFDLMDYGFRSPVARFSVEVVLPEAIDTRALTFRTNDMAPLSPQDVDLHVDGNRLRCAYTGLEKGHGLTMQLLLPSGYFDTHFTPDAFYIAAVCLSVAAIAALLLLKRFAVRPPGLILTAEYYSPDLSPIDAARLYRGRVRPKDFAALVLYWASQGLIEIKPQKDNQFLLLPVKAYPKPQDDDPERLTEKKTEERYFKALFTEQHRKNKLGEFRTGKTKRSKLSLGFHAAVNAVYKGSRKPTTAQILVRVAAHVLAAIPLLMSIVWSASLDASYWAVILLLFAEIAVLIFLYVSMPLFFKVIWCGLFGGAPLISFMVQGFSVYDISFFCVWSVLLFILGNVLARTVWALPKEKKDLCGRMLGFKRFLVTAELDKLEMLVEETPDYFLDILPYCYVFGITQKMESKFRALRAPMPQTLAVESYGALCRGISHSMRSSSTYRSFSSGRRSGGSGGGGGGGGGSSGGGGGGGGCGGR